MLGSHNIVYVNQFVRGIRALGRLRNSSTVDRQLPITKVVEKPAPVASVFEAIPSRQGAADFVVCPDATWKVAPERH